MSTEALDAAILHILDSTDNEGATYATVVGIRNLINSEVSKAVEAFAEMVKAEGDEGGDEIYPVSHTIDRLLAKYKYELKP